MRPVAIYLAFWFILLLVAIGNGLLREAIFSPALPELQAHQLSTLTGVFATGCAVWLMSRWQRPASATEAIVIGIVWVLSTVAFEFLFGLFVVGHQLQRLLLDYNLCAGRVWLFFLAWLLVLPYFAFRLSPTAKHR